MGANYNNSAWFYDRLARLVYGQALLNAQVYLLQFIGPNTKILIAGGGTGWILDEITRVHQSGLQITYIEIAAKMMALSRKRNMGGNRVVFIHQAVEDVDLADDFDIIITPFLFDNFTEPSFQKLFKHLSAALQANGVWHNADFQLTGKWWQNLLLKSMFLFFRIWCGIEASKLPAVKKQFEKNGYTAIAQKTFFGDFIVSEVYRKS